MISTGTHLAVIPAAVLPAYSASKAALNVFTLCLREQLKATDSKLKVIEIYPPPVQSTFSSSSLSPLYFSIAPF